MGKKKRQSKKQRLMPVLSSAESQELDVIVDRLRVQDPDGESLSGYLESLQDALAEREHLVAALIDRLSREPGEVPFKAFMRFKTLVGDKRYHRLVRQAQYRFKQRGLSTQTAEEAQHQDQKIFLVPRSSLPTQAHMAHAGPGLEIVTAFVPDRSGDESVLVYFALSVHWQIQDNRIEKSSRGLYKEFVRYVGRSSSSKVYEIPVWHAALLFFESLQYHPDQGGGNRIDEIEAVLKPWHDSDKKPYAHELFPPADYTNRGLLAGQTKDVLFRLGLAEMAPLIADKEQLQPFWQQAIDVEESVLVVPQDIKEQRLDDIMKKATDAIFDQDILYTQKRYLEEQAVRCKLTENPELATATWTIAQHLGSIEIPSESLYLQQLVTTAFYYHWRKELENALDNSVGGEPQNLHQTESGLILPG